MIAAFQWGLGALFGLLQTTQIESWVPMFMFTLLFGLSMDCEVFLVSRMRESWDAHGSNRRAVAHGLSPTGRIVTAAGLIMVATFSGFLLGSIGTMQHLGFGLHRDPDRHHARPQPATAGDDGPRRTLELVRRSFTGRSTR